MSKNEYIKPTESELEILQILWHKNKASVREVHDEMSKHKVIGYTTTLKLMQIMFEKGLVHRDNSVKVHIYTPALAQDVAQKHAVNKMLHTLFNGNTSQMVMQLLGNHKPSKDELSEIENYLKTKM
jgi:BlaI family transcriptional regulator, penicillinase repressor